MATVVASQKATEPYTVLDSGSRVWRHGKCQLIVKLLWGKVHKEAGPMSGFFCGFLCLPRLRLIVSRGRSVAVVAIALELAVLSCVGQRKNGEGTCEFHLPSRYQSCGFDLGRPEGLVESRH